MATKLKSNKNWQLERKTSDNSELLEVDGCRSAPWGGKDLNEKQMMSLSVRLCETSTSDLFPGYGLYVIRLFIQPHRICINIFTFE